jgi:hypothetical protein
VMVRMVFGMFEILEEPVLWGDIICSCCS